MHFEYFASYKGISHLVCFCNWVRVWLGNWLFFVTYQRFNLQGTIQFGIQETFLSSLTEYFYGRSQHLRRFIKITRREIHSTQQLKGELHFPQSRLAYLNRINEIAGEGTDFTWWHFLKAKYVRHLSTRHSLAPQQSLVLFSWYSRSSI